MNDPEDNYQLQLHSRKQKAIALNIPEDTLVSLEKVAASREMSLDALLKFYIGQGLRQDLARSFSNRILEATERVLSRHFASEEEKESVLREIRGEIDRL